MSYLVIKTTRSSKVVPYTTHWTHCQDHRVCYGLRWTDNEYTTHELHVVPSNDAVAAMLNPPPTVYSVHGLGDSRYHNIQWCRKYCGGRPPSELQEEFPE